MSFKVVENKGLISETFGISVERANEMRAIIMVSMYLYNLDSVRVLKIDTFDVVTQNLLDRIDQTSVPEVLYAGFKLKELIEDTHRGGVLGLLERVNEYTQGTFEDRVSQLTKQLKPK